MQYKTSGTYAAPVRAGSFTPDTQAPTPPGGVAISAFACRSATLGWKASTDNVGIAYYDIYRDGQPLGTVSAGMLTARLGSYLRHGQLGHLCDNYVWSYGHRNPQGLAFDSRGRLWEQEFGDTQDETNPIVRGGNHGWPNCEGVTSRAGNGCRTAGYVAPRYTYRNSEGSCSGIAIVRDALYVACLAGKRLYRSDIGGDNLINVRQFFAAGDKDSVPNNTRTKVFRVTLRH